MGQSAGHVIVVVVSENVGRGSFVHPQCVVMSVVVLVVRPVGQGSTQVP